MDAKHATMPGLGASSRIQEGLTLILPLCYGEWLN